MNRPQLFATRSRVRLPKLRRHKPSGRAVVTLSGRDVYLGPHGSPEAKRAYDAAIGEWLANGRSMPAANAGTAGTVAELAAAYLEHADGYYRGPGGQPSREPVNVRNALRPLLASYPDLPATEFGPLKLRAVMDRMVRDGICRRTTNQRAGVIRRMFRWGVERELVPASALHALTAVAGLRAGRTAARESHPVAPVPDGDVERTLPFLSALVRAMVQVQRLCGMRPGETCRMTTGEIDRSGDVWLYLPVRHKGAWRGKPRVVAIGPKAQDVLRPFLREDAPAAPLFSPKAAMAELRAKQAAARKTPASCGNRVGTNSKQRPKRAPRDAYDTMSYGAAIARAARKAGVKPWSPNRLRHAAATETRSRDGLEAAQLLLGHARADVTQIYAEANVAKLVELARRHG